MTAQWYSRRPRAGAVYAGAWSLHWAAYRPLCQGWLRTGCGPIVDYDRPMRRQIVLYRGVRAWLRLPLWLVREPAAADMPEGGGDG